MNIFPRVNIYPPFQDERIGPVYFTWGSINYANALGIKYPYPITTSSMPSLAHYHVLPWPFVLRGVQHWETSQIATGIATEAQLRRATDTISVGPLLSKAAGVVTVRQALAVPILLAQGEKLCVRWQQFALGAASAGVHFLAWGTKLP